MLFGINMSVNLQKYLEKSKDTIDDFHNDPGIFTDLKEPNLDWLDYKVYDDIFWIRTLYKGKNTSRAESVRIWEKIKDLAKSLGCDRIQFTTKRNGKVWEKLFKDMKVVQWKIEVEL